MFSKWILYPFLALAVGADGLGLEIHNLVNISSINSNYELAMRMSSNIDNGDVFYTDLNGLQVKSNYIL